MPQDHFVAQTYLKRFARPAGSLLQGYRKSRQDSFPCKPRDICRELDGDVIPDFTDYPNALGDYRNLFEPSWQVALDHLLIDHNAADDVKLAVAGYAANLLGSNPTMTRLAIEANNFNTIETIRAQQKLLALRGAADAKILQAIEMIDAGEIYIETDPNWARATNAQRLMKFAWRLYNSDWIVIENRTEVDFLTSDYPFVFEDPGPYQGEPPMLPRYLPLSPKSCLYVAMDVRKDVGKVELTKRPMGTVKFATSDRPEGIRFINRLIVQGAEDLIVSSRKDEAVADLVKCYADHRVYQEFLNIPEKRSVLLGIRTRVGVPPSKTS